jgi:NitT/TauT family transport system substrate-binding protein
VLGAAKSFVDANPTAVRVVIAALAEAMAQIARDPHRAAELYVAKEAPTMDPREAEENITDGSTGFDVTPTGTMRYAEFLLRNGMLKTAPASWQEVYFPLVHDRPGS